MAKFDCQGCGRTISVPDQYAGKRVRCPGCQAPQRVPMPEAAKQAAVPLQAMVDLSGLDAREESGVRRLRQILIGCGECQKTIKIPESKLGKTTPCTSCGVVLKVDAFNLAKAKGDLIDMTHLELEKADLLLDGGSHGSTIGGSSIQLDAGGSTLGTGGYELNMPPSGSMSGVSMSNSSQSQMRELRELNDLKHSGQISSQEYRERKKEIYAGKSLAIQAMSRSADGSGNRPVIKRNDKPALLPGPIKMLIVLAIVAGGGYAGWAVLTQPSTTASDTVAITPQDPTPENSADETQEPNAAEGLTADAEGGVVVDPAPTPDETLSADAETTEMTADESGGEPSVDESEPLAFMDETVTILEIEPSLSVVGESTLEVDAISVDEMMVADWPTDWPSYQLNPGDTSAIGKACDVLQRISVRDNSAIIGVNVGPPAESLDSVAYRNFRQSMQDILTDTAREDRIFDDLNIRSSERTAQLGTLESHRLHVTSKSNRDVRATILTGIQDGHSVSYWFAGSKTIYADFLKTVGLAELAPAQ